MLTDAALKNLKSRDKPYQVTDRDGMYVRVGTKGTISFRYDYRVNGRRETVTFGKYGSSGLSLARALSRDCRSRGASDRNPRSGHRQADSRRRPAASAQGKTFPSKT